jgi:hypothetical protein
LSPSLKPYSARLRIDARARNLVVASGAILGASGLVMISALPFGRLVLGWLLAGWSLASAAGLRRAARAGRARGSLVINADGEVRIAGHGMRHDVGYLLPGSLVVPAAAWLRIEAPVGTRWNELILGCRQDREQWRRFQVICRHLTA